jgi:hypothetical protein
MFSMMNEVAPTPGGVVAYAEGTMLWGYDLAKVKAITWQPDAKYIGCAAPSVDASGKGEWWYLFNSATDTANVFLVKVVNAGNITTETAGGAFPYNINFSYFKSNSDVWMKVISDTPFKSGPMSVLDTYYVIDGSNAVISVYYNVSSSVVTAYNYHVHLYPGFSVEKVNN